MKKWWHQGAEESEIDPLSVGEEEVTDVIKERTNEIEDVNAFHRNAVDLDFRAQKTTMMPLPEEVEHKEERQKQEVKVQAQ